MYGLGREARTGHPDPSLVERFVHGVGDVEGARGLPHHVGVGVLVDHVGGHRQRRARRREVERLDGEPVVVDLDEHAAAARVGRALPTALGGLGGVPGRTGRAPARSATAASTAVSVARPAMITSAPASRALDERLRAEQPDDVVAPVEELGGQRL